MPNIKPKFLWLSCFSPSWPELAWHYFPATALILLVEIAFYSLVFVFIVLDLVYKKLGLYKPKWLGGVLMHTILLLLGWMGKQKVGLLKLSLTFTLLLSISISYAK